MDIGESKFEEGIDRLSYLPDHIRDHILNFLDTKDSVQTSVLSTRWRSHWKHTNHLNFDSASFPSYLSFIKFVKDALEFFGDDSRIVKLSYKDRDLWRCDHFRELDMVMAYVASHPRIRRVRVHNGRRGEMAQFKYLVGSLLDCDLDTLELGRVSLRPGNDWRGFRILKNLVLEHCLLDCEGVKEVDFFAKFPCLTSLVLSGCEFDHSGRTLFKISGPQLLNLEIHGIKNLGLLMVEIVAPKLKFLTFVFDSDCVPEFGSRFCLPVLDHAYIGTRFVAARQCCEDDEDEEEEEKGDEMVITANFVNLFKGLHNVTSLRLDHHIIEGMSRICDELRHQPCPFTRLKCLKLWRSDYEDEPCIIPDYLMNYFLKGSSSTNPPAGFLQFI